LNQEIYDKIIRMPLPIITDQEALQEPILDELRIPAPEPLRGPEEPQRDEERPSRVVIIDCW